MIGTFWFLTRRSLANRIQRQLSRLKEPRYAIALLAAFGYLYLFLFRRPDAASSEAAATRFQTLVSVLGSLFILFAVVRWWVFGGDRSALTFSAAEVQFLFPAPVSRASLIRWKLFRSQILILINTVVWILIARRARPPLPFPVYLVSLWTLFTTLSLHRLGASLTRAGVATHWRTGLRRQWLPLSIAAIAATVLAVSLAGSWPALMDRCCGMSFWTLLNQLITEPPASIVLYPFRLVMAPVAASDLDSWFRLFFPAFGLLVVHYVWVIRSNAAFEESAVLASAEHAERIARVRSSGPEPSRVGRRQLVRLDPRGWPGGAIVWKNLLAIVRGSLSGRTLVMILILGIAMTLALGVERGGFSELVGTIGVVMTAMLLLMGHNWVRNDLRQDLAYLPLLRSYPLPGRSIVTAEIISSTLALTVLQYGFALVAAFGMRHRPELAPYLTLGTILLVVPALLLVLNTIVLTIQNAGALLFPTWVRFDRVRPGGFETMGQNILTSGFTILLTLVGLIVPAGVAFTLFTVGAPTLGRAAALPAAVGFVAAAAVEITALLVWMGRLFDRTETI